ncbi:NAD(P)H-quinone oxidoreductase [Deinococcus marmoris]|uniref:Quinone oxidoreductase n=1 Tax=Deinococcus marmoris TaxID=249408 RepID=A0A1U7P3F6_9DEIO|nr:NAD(P)H-quinone oxidoreductase [Deinococcus marmoris]OLV19702.1 Quinone oxidoreductase [Deinococcus marmoris]
MTTIPESMQAISIQGGSGPASALQLEGLSVPTLGEEQILIKVAAAGINRPDIFQRMGFYPPPPGAPATLGLEVAGTVVVAAGRWQVGDRVCALLGGGGYAEYVACDARHALPIPAGLSFVEAASLPETVFTVYANVFDAGGLKAGETFMVHGATSGIGVTAIQMAQAAGARVIATARGAAKAEAARALGADIVVDTSTEDFAQVAQQAGGVDVVLDIVGASYFAGNLAALKHKGRIVFIASLGGNDVTLPVMALMQKQAVVTGSTLRGRSANEKAALALEVERVVWPWIAGGQLRAQVDQTFPLADAAAAHQYLEDGAHVGKVILTMPAN